MTGKQLDFIRSLASERVIDGDAADEMERARGAYVRRLVAGELGEEPDVGKASSIIEWLLAQPRRPDAPARGNGGPLPEVPQGRYAVELGGVLRFFKVDRPEEGRWAGRQFLSEVIGGEARGRSIREHGEAKLVLDSLAVAPEEAQARYGREIGKCGVCNRTLTDELSRASGIGPDCAEQRGIDRQALVAAGEEQGR